MIYVTGDCHSDFRKFNMDSFPEQKYLTKNDYVIICGDFGGIWAQEETKEEKYWLDWLNSRSFTTLFVSGNHENFDRLYRLPEIDFCGGKAGMVRPSVLHLKRGEIYNIGGVKTFAFGGASSHDISDGILDMNDPDLKEKELKLKKAGKFLYRVKGRTWWPEELPSQEEIDHAVENLEKHNFEVDLIVSHCASTRIQRVLEFDGEDKLTGFFTYIMAKTSYKKWYFGHYHFNAPFDDKHGCLYQYILPWTNEHEHVGGTLLYK